VKKKDCFYTNKNVLMKKIRGVKSKANFHSKPCTNQNGLTKKIGCEEEKKNFKPNNNPKCWNTLTKLFENTWN